MDQSKDIILSKQDEGSLDNIDLLGHFSFSGWCCEINFREQMLNASHLHLISNVSKSSLPSSLRWKKTHCSPVAQLKLHHVTFYFTSPTAHRLTTTNSNSPSHISTFRHRNLHYLKITWPVNLPLSSLWCMRKTSICPWNARLPSRKSPKWPPATRWVLCFLTSELVSATETGNRSAYKRTMSCFHSLGMVHLSKLREKCRKLSFIYVRKAESLQQSFRKPV